MPQQDEEIETVHYDTWATSDMKTTGYVAVYRDDTGTWVKIVHNGVIKCYEKVSA